MHATRYVALLRGINVGGRNRVPMTDLRAAFENAGFESVSTYIQSGNVLFSTATPAATLEHDVEAFLQPSLGIPLVVVVRSHRQLRAVVDRAPDGFGASPGTFHSDVIFLKPPLTSAQALAALERRDGVDEAWAGPGVVYFARRSAQLTASRLGRVSSKREYQAMTIRSWSTTTKLLALLDA